LCGHLLFRQGAWLAPLFMGYRVGRDHLAGQKVNERCILTHCGVMSRDNLPLVYKGRDKTGQIIGVMMNMIL